VGCVGEEQKDLTLDNLYCCGEFRALGIIGYNKKNIWQIPYYF